MERISTSPILACLKPTCMPTWRRQSPHLDLMRVSRHQILLFGYVTCCLIHAAISNILQCKDYGYAVVRIDVRGSGGSPGVLDPFGMGRTALTGEDSEALGRFQLPTSSNEKTRDAD